MPIERGDRELVRGMELRDRLWKPDAAINPEGQTYSRRDQVVNVANPFVSGTLLVAGGAVALGGVKISGITVSMGTAVSTVTTNRWFCLIDRNLNVLAKTVDQGAVETTANQMLNLVITNGFTPADDIAVYIGMVNVGTTGPDVRAKNGSYSVGGGAANPPIAGTSTTGLTNPASLGATAAAITAGNIQLYAHLT